MTSGPFPWRELASRLYKREEEADAAVALIIEKRGPSVLLIKRTDRRGDRWAGQIGLPGGFRRPSDAGALQTALREAKEEVGLDLKALALYLGHLSPHSPKNRPEVRVLPFVFLVEGVKELSCDPQEVQEARWVPLGELRPAEDAFIYRDWRIWGLTARILTDLRRLLGFPDEP